MLFPVFNSTLSSVFIFKYKKLSITLFFSLAVSFYFSMEIKQRKNSKVTQAKKKTNKKTIVVHFAEWTTEG